jgi:hypothetical protein
MARWQIGVSERRVPIDRVSEGAVALVRTGELRPHAALALVVDCVRHGRVRPQSGGATCEPGRALLHGRADA